MSFAEKDGHIMQHIMRVRRHIWKLHMKGLASAPDWHDISCEALEIIASNLTLSWAYSLSEIKRCTDVYKMAVKRRNKLYRPLPSEASAALAAVKELSLCRKRLSHSYSLRVIYLRKNPTVVSDFKEWDEGQETDEEVFG